VCKLSTVTYSQSFPSGTVDITSSQCTAWQSFTASLSAATTYTSVTIKGSNDSTGVTCTGTNANTLCQALRTQTAVTGIACGGRTWATSSTCTVDGSTQMELSANGDQCNCASGYVVRPCIGNNNWGGVAGPTCGAATQTLTVVCQ